MNVVAARLIYLPALPFVQRQSVGITCQHDVERLIWNLCFMTQIHKTVSMSFFAKFQTSFGRHDATQWQSSGTCTVVIANLMVMSPCQAAELDILQLVIQISGVSSVLVNSEHSDVDPV